VKAKFSACCVACRTTIINNHRPAELLRQLTAHHKVCGKPRTWTRRERPYAACCTRCRRTFAQNRVSGLSDTLRKHTREKCDNELRRQRIHNDQNHRRKASYKRYEKSKYDFVTASCVDCHYEFRSVTGSRTLNNTLRQHRKRCRGWPPEKARKPKKLPPGIQKAKAMFPSVSWSENQLETAMTDAIEQRILRDMGMASTRHPFGECMCVVCREVEGR
jgi:hypothetical protein